MNFYVMTSKRQQEYKWRCAKVESKTRRVGGIGDQASAALMWKDCHKIKGLP